MLSTHPPSAVIIAFIQQKCKFNIWEMHRQLRVMLAALIENSKYLTIFLLHYSVNMLV
jgi:hypothetical protein